MQRNPKNTKNFNFSLEIDLTMTQNDPNQPQRWLKWIDWVSKIDGKSYNEFVLIEFRSIFVIFFYSFAVSTLNRLPL